MTRLEPRWLLEGRCIKAVQPDIGKRGQTYWRP
jgi:hypothetical protein